MVETHAAAVHLSLKKEEQSTYNKSDLYMQVLPSEILKAEFYRLKLYSSFAVSVNWDYLSNCNFKVPFSDNLLNPKLKSN